MKGLRDRKVFEKIHESDAMTVAPLMEVVNKLIDTEEDWSTSLTTMASKTLAPLVLPVIPARSSVSHLQRCLRRTGGDPQRSTTRSSTQCSTAPARSTKGHPHSPQVLAVQEGVSRVRGLQTIYKHRR
jgi:hypothetical protein